MLETRYLQLVRNAGLPTGIPQFEIRRLGARRSRNDQTRENDAGALGWRVLRFDWDDVNKRPEYVLQMLRTALRPSA